MVPIWKSSETIDARPAIQTSASRTQGSQQEKRVGSIALGTDPTVKKREVAARRDHVFADLVRDEVSQMHWRDLDLNSLLWVLPSERTKSRRMHKIPLCPLAVAVIQSLPRLHPTLVFPARGKDSSISGFSKWKRALDERSGVTGWRLHDIRRTVATDLAALRISPHVIERLLNHSAGTLGGNTGIYIRFDYLEEIREALLLWEDHLQAIALQKR